MPSLPSHPFRRPAWWTRESDYSPRVGEIHRLARGVEADSSRTWVVLKTLAIDSAPVGSTEATIDPFIAVKSHILDMGDETSYAGIFATPFESRAESTEEALDITPI